MCSIRNKYHNHNPDLIYVMTTHGVHKFTNLHISVNPIEEVKASLERKHIGIQETFVYFQYLYLFVVFPIYTSCVCVCTAYHLFEGKSHHYKMVRSGNCVRAAINSAIGMKPALVSVEQMQLRRRHFNLPTHYGYWCMADVHFLATTKVIPFFFRPVQVRHWYEFKDLTKGIFVVMALMYKRKTPCVHTFVVNCFTRRVLDNFHKNTFALDNDSWVKRVQLKQIQTCYVLYKFN